MKRIFLVPQEHEKAMMSFMQKLNDAGNRNGAVIFVTATEMDAVKAQHFVDIPDGNCNSYKELPSEVEDEDGCGR